MSNSQDLAIQTERLRKEYGTTVAVDDLNLAVERGEIFGFLGPNGAGKTTSLKMLLGLARPTAGAAWVLGRPAGDWRVRARVGFLPEHFRFQEWLKATEFLEVHARLYGMPADARRRRVGELLETVGLSRHADKPLRDFSKGMLQRIGLAQALLNEPDLVFLDEPTSGLDPLGRRLVRDIIHSLRARGITVFLNSHLLSEIEITCDRVSFIRRGRIVQTGKLEQLLAAETEVELRVNGLSPELLRDAARFGQSVSLDTDRLVVRMVGEEGVPDLVAWLVRQGARVYSVTPRRLSLEDLFLRLMEGEEAG
ncbi:MAG: ABC transporter ATP-binding protein [Anaerolineae bacterium]|nr:ABC transporter ATP-binding protein [Anaerolineae bacterium]